MTCFLALALLSVALRSVVASRPLQITENGVKADYYLSPTDGKTGGPNVTGSKLTLKYGERFYLMKIDKQHSSDDKDDFHLLDLVDKTINVTVDLNGASCGCNVAFYLVSMPSTRNTPGTGNDWYCDANNVGGNACPEIDLVEMNQNALHTTMHTCAREPWSKANCDGGGYGTRFGQGDKDLGIGPGFTVDTTRPLVVTNTFTSGNTGGAGAGTKRGSSSSNSSGSRDRNGNGNGNSNSNGTRTLSLTTTITQAPWGGGSAVRTIADTSNIRDPLSKGMVLVMSYWGSTSMGWLDAPPCTSDSASSCPATVELSGITISGGGPGPSPSPAPSPGPSPEKCPGPSPTCNCAWTRGGAACGADDGSECWCRCCCPFTSGHTCTWKPPEEEEEEVTMVMEAGVDSGARVADSVERGESGRDSRPWYGEKAEARAREKARVVVQR